MRLKRTIHLQSQIAWLPLRDIAPDVQVQTTMQENGQPPELHGLAFTDADGESHIYVLDDGGKEALVRQLTGGIVLPR